MGASFRNKDEIVELAGCDLLTISPQFLEELSSSQQPLVRKLSPETAKQSPIGQLHLSEAQFRLMFNEDAMATEKLAEGIRNFAKDAKRLKEYVDTL